jgi:type IV secretion system protein VirD4
MKKILEYLKGAQYEYIGYVFVFWLFCKFGEAYRIAVGKDFLQKFIDTIDKLNAVMSNLMITFNPNDLFIGLAGTAIIYFIVYFKSKNAKKYRKNVEYGSARWGNSTDIKPFIDVKPDNNVILTKTESLTLNGRPKNPKYARNKNVLVVGGSGSGKTRFFVKPNLMQLHSSYVVTDSKGTLVLETGKFLHQNGYKIKILNTIDFSKSMRYNPFEYIHSEKDILKFVTSLIANTKSDGKSSDPFWEKSEILLYTALIAYIHYEGTVKERNMNMLIGMINEMEVRETNESFRNAIDRLFDELEKKNPEHFAVRQYRKFKLAAGVVSSNGLPNRSPLLLRSRACGTGERTRGHGLQPGKEYCEP